MRDALHRLKQVLKTLLEYVVIGVMALLVLDVLWGVASRFLLGSPSRWTEEVATFLLIWVSLLGAAVAFSRQEHLGVDYLIKKLDPQAQQFLAVVAQLIIIIFAGLTMVYGGYVLVTETLHSGQLTPALGVRMGYVYLAVPISGVFTVLFCVEQIAEILSKKAPDQATSMAELGNSERPV